MRLRVGVIGTGYLGSLRADRLARFPDITLVGVFDQDTARAQTVAARLQCAAFSTMTGLIHEIDAAVVSVPARHHFEVAQAVLAAGRPVLVEKPLALDLGEAGALIRQAREQAAMLQVGHVERFNPAFEAAADLIRRPAFLEVHRLSPFGARGLDSDVVLEVMIHDLDLVQAIVARPVQEIDAVGVPVLSSRLDIANARLRFSGGCVANLTASRVSPARMRKLRVFQNGEYLSIDLETREVARILRRTSEDGSVLEAMPVPIAPADALERELRDFVDAVKTGRRPRVDGESGLRALELALRVRTALERQVSSAPQSVVDGP